MMLKWLKITFNQTYKLNDDDDDDDDDGAVNDNDFVVVIIVAVTSVSRRDAPGARPSS